MSSSKKIAFFGATGGLGAAVSTHLSNRYTIDRLGSNSVNFLEQESIANYFSKNDDIDVVIIFTNYNHNAFLHKYTKTDSELEKQLTTNILGVTRCLSHALDLMRKRRSGRIILASSITTSRKVMGTSVYAATKAYYENIVQSIALENASLGITANCIQLGYMDGGLTYTLPETFIQETIQQIPAKRLGSTKEIADTVDFLIQNEYINGTTIKLAGGL